MELIDSDDSVFAQGSQSRLWLWPWTADMASEEGRGRRGQEQIRGPGRRKTDVLLQRKAADPILECLLLNYTLFGIFA